MNNYKIRFFFNYNIIFFFTFFIARYYFSDENYKNSYRSTSLLDEKIKESEDDLILLKNNTENIIEFVEYKNYKEKKNYSFWKLLYNDH